MALRLQGPVNLDTLVEHPLSAPRSAPSSLNSSLDPSKPGAITDFLVFSYWAKNKKHHARDSVLYLREFGIVVKTLAELFSRGTKDGGHSVGMRDRSTVLFMVRDTPC